MNTAIGWMSAGLLLIWAGTVILIPSFFYFTEDLKNRLYPKGNTQDLVTECQLDEKLKAKEPQKYDGYFYDGSQKVDCNIIDQTEKDYKVGWEVPYYRDTHHTIYDAKAKWLPKKDFHKYYTTEELSEIVNKKGAGR